MYTYKINYLGHYWCSDLPSMFLDVINQKIIEIQGREGICLCVGVYLVVWGVYSTWASIAIRHHSWHQRSSRVCLSLRPVSVLRYGSALRMYSCSAPISAALGPQFLKTLCTTFILVSVWSLFSLHHFYYNAFPLHSNPPLQHPNLLLPISTSGFEITSERPLGTQTLFKWPDINNNIFNANTLGTAIINEWIITNVKSVINNCMNNAHA